MRNSDRSHGTNGFYCQKENSIIPFEVQIKGWIPHKRLPDIEQVLLGGVTLGMSRAFFEMFYGGDDHHGYDGTHRALTVAFFDWDGSQITNFFWMGDKGITTKHRVNIWTGRDNRSEQRSIGEVKGEQLRKDQFRLSFSVKNPMLPLNVSPYIDFVATFTVSNRGIQVQYTSDQFPSYGIRIAQDGQIISTRIVKDVRNVAANDATGPSIALEMTRHTNSGSYFVPMKSQAALKSMAFSVLQQKPVMLGFTIVGALAVLRFAFLFCTKKSEYSVVV